MNFKNDVIFKPNLLSTVALFGLFNLVALWILITSTSESQILQTVGGIIFANILLFLFTKNGLNHFLIDNDCLVVKNNFRFNYVFRIEISKMRKCSVNYIMRNDCLVVVMKDDEILEFNFHELSKKDKEELVKEINRRIKNK